MEYDFNVVHRLGVKHQAADPIRTDGEDEELLEDEVPCLLISSAPEPVDAPPVAAGCYDGKKETIFVDWQQEKPAGMGLPAVMEVNTDMEDISPITVEGFLRELAKKPLCLSALEKWETVRFSST